MFQERIIRFLLLFKVEGFIQYAYPFFFALVPVPTTPEVPVTVTTQKPSPGKLTYPRCAWSDWLSSTAPTAAPTSGDMETIENLKKRFGLCPNIVDIECRVIDNGSGTSAAQDSVTCDIQNGLRCYNRDQLSFQCHDYEVRVKCWDSSCKFFTLTQTLFLAEFHYSFSNILSDSCFLFNYNHQDIRHTVIIGYIGINPACLSVLPSTFHVRADTPKSLKGF